MASTWGDTPPGAKAGRRGSGNSAGTYLLFLGRLDARKGVDVLLNALAAADRCRLDLVVAGKGPESAALTALAQRLGLASRVHFVGVAEGDRKIWLLQNGLCTILSSRIWEAFPVVLIESYAAGRPVIATDVPGLRERVQPGRTGLLVARKTRGGWPKQSFA